MVSTRLLLSSLALSLAFVFFATIRKRKSSPKPQIPSKHAFWYIGTPEFFADPFRFLEESIEWAKGQMFAFNVMSNTVIVLRGLTGRDAFFSKGLDFMSGYRLLNPQLVDVMPVTEISGDESWASFMANFIRTEVLERMYPIMLEDISKITSTWGDKGSLDPFESVYELVFTLSVRLSTCREFSDSPENIKALMKIFNRMEAGSTPTSIILPWIPTPSRFGRLLAGRDLYMMISNVVKARKREGRREDDPMQVLIDKGMSLVDITRFIAMTLFAAVTNTGGVMCWLVIYLEAHPEWKKRVRGEVEQFIRDNCTDPSVSLTTAISEVPVTVMDESTPSLELTMNETMRILFNGTFMRRNIGEDIFVDGVRIKNGAFLMYPTGDLHFNPDLYPDPLTFDPLRFTPEAIEERKKLGITFLGWGASRHVCVGRRAATLMIKMIMIQLMANFDYDIADGEGHTIVVPPKPYNDRLFKVNPPKEKVFMRYSKKVL